MSWHIDCFLQNESSTFTMQNSVWGMIWKILRGDNVFMTWSRVWILRDSIRIDFSFNLFEGTCNAFLMWLGLEIWMCRFLFLSRSSKRGVSRCVQLSGYNSQWPLANSLYLGSRYLLAALYIVSGPTEPSELWLNRFVLFSLSLYYDGTRTTPSSSSYLGLRFNWELLLARVIFLFLNDDFTRCVFILF